jgi:hypothetical protein
MAFIDSNTTNNTIIAAAATSWNSACGLDIQLNIWIGKTVN